MPTDDERREVASNIMENYVCGGLGYKVSSAHNIAMAIGMNPGLLVGDIELWERLADLIDPGESGQNRDRNQDTVQNESPGVQMAPACDRDALLALADAMEEKADDWDVSQNDVPLVHAGYLTAYAERIRKALGIKDEEPDLGENFCDGCEFHCDLWSGVNCPYERRE